MSDFKKFFVTKTMLDEYAWKIKSGDYFRCNEIGFNLERNNEKLKAVEVALDAANKYIKENPCDPDIYPEQLRAWSEYQQALEKVKTVTGDR